MSYVEDQKGEEMRDRENVFALTEAPDTFVVISICLVNSNFSAGRVSCYRGENIMGEEMTT